MMATSTKPSWKKLKNKLRENSEEDGPFQDGEYEEPEDLTPPIEED